MVDHVRATWQVSIRRACRALPVDRSTYHYRSRRTEQAGLEKRIKEIAETRVRYGYRRIHVLLRREGWAVNAKRVCRLYREMGLQLRNKTPKRRVKAKLREDRTTATRSERDLGDGLRPRPAVRRHEDPGADHRRHVHAALAGDRRRGRAIAAADVVETLERGCGRARLSRRRSASTTAPSSSARISICGRIMHGVTLDFSRPGKPTDNAFIESFNGKFRAECLNANWFLSLDEARRKCEAWRRDYNEVRPHSAIGNKTPMELHRTVGITGQPARPRKREFPSAGGPRLGASSVRRPTRPQTGGVARAQVLA